VNLFDKHDQQEHLADLAEKRAASRASDPETSMEAADQVESSGKAGRQRMICLKYVKENPGQTAAEIAREAGLERHVPSRRLPELRPKYVKNGHARVCMVTGSKSMTWYPVQ